MQTKSVMNYSVLALIVGTLAYAGVQQAKEYKQAPFKQQVLETQREADAAAEQEKIAKRESGFVGINVYKNAFDEAIGKDYRIHGIKENSFITVYEEENGIDAVCFQVFTNDKYYELYHPSFKSVDVYIKFDGGETKTFASREGRGGSLCVAGVSRFMDNLRKSSSVAVALPFLDYSNHVTEIYEFNLKTFNGIAQ